MRQSLLFASAPKAHRFFWPIFIKAVRWAVDQIVAARCGQRRCAVGACGQLCCPHVHTSPELSTARNKHGGGLGCSQRLLARHRRGWEWAT